MADLVRGQPALKVEFLPSLGLDVLSTMGLICLVHDFEGLSEWVIETAAALPPGLRHDMQRCMRIGKYPYLVMEGLAAHLFAAADSPAHVDAAALVAGIEALSPADCHAILTDIFAFAAQREEVALDRPIDELVADRARLEALAARLAVPLAPGEVAAFFDDPAAWRDALAATTRRFWEDVYAPIYADQQPQRERNITYQRSHSYSQHFPELFASVTGRMLPERLHGSLERIREARFVPSQFIGPYLAFLFNEPILTVFYNSSVTLTEGDAQMERTQGLYQPLAALADKTRLQIMALLHSRELYAQEIVNLLEIHQSAVSRHLKLMETAGVLLVRRDRGAKYYSINQQRIEQISSLLRELV